MYVICLCDMARAEWEGEGEGDIIQRHIIHVRDIDMRCMRNCVAYSLCGALGLQL
jgi:hypothetical protein